MEREPEEDGDAEHGTECVEALLDFGSHGALLFLGIFNDRSCDLLGWLWEDTLVGQEDDERDEHSNHRGNERIVDALVEDGDVVVAECGIVNKVVTGKHHLFECLAELGGLLAVSKELVAECRHVGIVDQCVLGEPPLAKQWSDERSKQTADVDEHVEDLETGVTLVLSYLEGFGTLLGSLCFIFVVHLADDGLQIALEETIAKSDGKEGHTGEDENAPPAAAEIGLTEDWNGESDVAQCHNDQTPLDGAVVVLGAVGDDAAHKAQHIDAEVKH